MTYKNIDNLTSPNLQDALKEYHPLIISDHQELLKTNKFQTQTFGARAFSCSAPVSYSQPEKRNSPSHHFGDTLL